jgi:hypothetical protein
LIITKGKRRGTTLHYLSPQAQTTFRCPPTIGTTTTTINARRLKPRL